TDKPSRPQTPGKCEGGVMPSIIVCPPCRSKLRLADRLVGKVIRCPRCTRKLIFHQHGPAGNGTSASPRPTAAAESVPAAVAAASAAPAVAEARDVPAPVAAPADDKPQP